MEQIKKEIENCIEKLDIIRKQLAELKQLESESPEVKVKIETLNKEYVDLQEKYYQYKRLIQIPLYKAIEAMSQEDINKFIDNKVGVLSEELSKVQEEKNNLINSKEMQLLEDQSNISDIGNSRIIYQPMKNLNLTMFYKAINEKNITAIIKDYNEYFKRDSNEEKDFLLFIVKLNKQITNEINILRKNGLPCDEDNIIKEIYLKNEEEYQKRRRQVQSSVVLDIIERVIDIENNIKLLNDLGVDTEEYTSKDIRNKEHIGSNSILYDLNNQIRTKLESLRDEVLESLNKTEEKESQIKSIFDKFDLIKNNPENFKEILYNQFNLKEFKSYINEIENVSQEVNNLEEISKKTGKNIPDLNENEKVSLIENLKELLQRQEQNDLSEKELIKLRNGLEKLDQFKDSEKIINHKSRLDQIDAQINEKNIQEPLLKEEVRKLREEEKNLTHKIIVFNREKKLKEIKDKINGLEEKIWSISSNYNYQKDQVNKVIIDENIILIIEKYYVDSINNLIIYKTDMENTLKNTIEAFQTAISKRENRIKENNNYMNQLINQLNINPEVLTDLLKAIKVIESSKDEQQIKQSYELIEKYHKVLENPVSQNELNNLIEQNAEKIEEKITRKI